MLCGLIRLVSKIKWWLVRPKRKLCKEFCPTCPYYDICRSEVENLETVSGEPFE